MIEDWGWKVEDRPSSVLTVAARVSALRRRRVMMNAADSKTLEQNLRGRSFGGGRRPETRSVMKLPGGMDLQQMMKQAQKMQEQMMKEMESLRIDATAGGGIVKVEMNGLKEVLSVKIEPEAASDIEMLQDLIMAAINECGRKVDESASNRLGGALGGLNIPGLM